MVLWRKSLLHRLVVDGTQITHIEGWRPFEQKDYELSDAMSSYLCQFVKTGNPNQEGLPTWQPITESQKHVLRIGEGKIRMGSVNMAKLFITMLTNKAVGE